MPVLWNDSIADGGSRNAFCEVIVGDENTVGGEGGTGVIFRKLLMTRFLTL